MRSRNTRLRNALTPRGLGIIAAALALCAYAVSARGSARDAIFIWNASASAPIGLYRVLHLSELLRGRMVLALPTPSLADFAARRGYLPRGVPLVKRIAAVAGDAICARGNAVFINGRLAAMRRVTDGEGRHLPSWKGCRELCYGEIFLLMAQSHASFDGRYFGPTPTSEIVGTLEPIWTR